MCCMKEILTRALVLECFDVGEMDGLVRLYTKELGKVTARARSIRKITSKSGGHLQPLHFVVTRLVRRSGGGDGYGIVDASVDPMFIGASPQKRFDLIPLIGLLDRLTLDYMADGRLWLFVEKLFLKRYDHLDAVRTLISLLGFDPRSAACAHCHAWSVSAFVSGHDVFLCDSCALSVDSNAVEWIGEDKQPTTHN